MKKYIIPATEIVKIEAIRPIATSLEDSGLTTTSGGVTTMDSKVRFDDTNTIINTVASEW